MERLSADWLTEGMIDFEYKKYIVLAYLKQIGKLFGSVHLYPSLSDLIFHRENLERFMRNKETIWDQFPKKISKEDLLKLRLNYQSGIADDEVIKELEEIISFSLPRFTKMIEEGREIYEFVEKNLEFEPVGIVPMYMDEGYLLINHDNKREISIFKYKTSVFESANERYRGINLEFVSKDFVNLTRTFEKVKLELANRDKYLPNPATYSLVAKMSFPEQPTILPVAKRLLMRHLSQAA